MRGVDYWQVQPCAGGALQRVPASNSGGRPGPDDAGSLANELLAVQKRVLGAEHPDRLSTAGDLAQSLWHQEKYDEAEKISEREVLGVRWKGEELMW